ncbi:MAG TPA: fibronectin type III domain-containing protein, partial [Ignavibacteriaceae bacterium]|nr:fibronectin type III domain-containing protein [Ignavibacteriaceae bacterium]
MLKQTYTFFLTLLIALVFTDSIVAQSSSVGNTKDVYTGPQTKVQTPAGQNIPIPYDGTLAVLYDNGPLVTNPGGGAGGADLSALQSGIGLGTYGFGAQISAGYSVADDFTINGASWNIEELQFFTYQTGSSTTSTINDARVRIWNGAPNAGGTIIFGDLTTNRLTSTSWANMYRALDTSPTNTDRPIMKAVVQFSPALVLGPGTYWVEVSLGGTLASGPWAPPVSIVGQTNTGNALQLTSTGWAAAVDGSYPQGIPFIVLGNSGPPCPVQTPGNPTPANNAVNVPITGVTLSWSNGGPGTVPPTQVEVFFGPAGNMTSVYSGAPITQWAVPGSLTYFSNYQWKVVNKIDTCNISSSTWAFKTVQDPYITEYCEQFNDLSNWTVVGPYGLTNWTANASANAGGTAPELRMSWTPSFTGVSTIRQNTPMQLFNNFLTFFSFRFFLDWYAEPSGTVTVGITYDNGFTQEVLYQVVNPTANVGPILVEGTFITPATGSDNAKIQITYEGYSFNIDYIYLDDLCMYSSFSYPPTAPSNLTAQVIYDPEPKIKLNWQDNSFNENGFTIARKFGYPNDPGNYVMAGGVGPNITQFIDSDVIPETTYTYRVFAHNYAGQSCSNLATIFVPIPVELISFTVEVDRNSIRLFWQTATETNNEGFEVQRNTDGEFHTIAFV